MQITNPMKRLILFYKPIDFYRNSTYVGIDSAWYRLGFTEKKSNWLYFFLISQIEQWRPVVMNNRWKFQCQNAANKAYTTVQISYVNCMLKSEFLWYLLLVFFSMLLS